MDGFNVKEVSDYYGVSTFTVRRWILNGKLGAEKVGKGYIILPDNMEAFEKKYKIRPYKRKITHTSPIDHFDTYEKDLLASSLNMLFILLERADDDKTKFIKLLFNDMFDSSYRAQLPSLCPEFTKELTSFEEVC